MERVATVTDTMMGGAALLAAMVLLLSAAAADDIYRRNVNDCVNSEALKASSAEPDFFPWGTVMSSDVADEEPEYIEVETALGFTVKYYNTYKVVNNTIAGEVYVLYQCGSQPPKEVPQGAKVFAVPLTAVATPDTTAFAFLDALGVQDRVVSLSPFVSAPCGQALVECNRTADITMYDFSNATLVAEEFEGQADAILSSQPVAGPLGIAFSAVLDPGPLRRAEWIKYLGLFFNDEGVADALFNATAAEYEEYEALSASVPDRPVVAWASHFSYDGAESYQLSFAEYKANLVQDAGADMLDYEEVASIPGVTPSLFAMEILEFAWGVSNESFGTKEEAVAAFHEVLMGVDVLIDETYAPMPTEYNMTTFKAEYGLTGAADSGFPFLANSTVYRLDGRVTATGGTDWFEGAVVRAGDVLRDVVRALYPGLVKNPSSYNWIFNLAKGEKPQQLTPRACTVRGVCDIVPAAICPEVAACPDGSTVFLLGSSDDGSCEYEPCKA